MILRVPARCERQWLRCKEILRERLAPGGQVVGEAEIHSSAFALLESVLLKTGPDEAPARLPVLPFRSIDDDFVFDGNSAQDHIARASERRRGRSDFADIVERIDALSLKIDALADQKERCRDADEASRRDDDDRAEK